MSTVQTALNFLSVPLTRQWRPKITGYFETVVSAFDNGDIQRMFRPSGTAVEMLQRIIGAAVRRRQGTHLRGRQAVNVNKQVLILLYYMGTQDTDFQIGEKFGVSDSNVYTCVNRLIDILSAFIRWPTGERIKTVIDGFKRKAWHRRCNRCN